MIFKVHNYILIKSKFILMTFSPLSHIETPILGGAKVPMMRRSTIKALETRRDEVITERKQQSKMRTLGASNPHNNNKDKHR